MPKGIYPRSEEFKANLCTQIIKARTAITPTSRAKRNISLKIYLQTPKGKANLAKAQTAAHTPEANAARSTSMIGNQNALGKHTGPDHPRWTGGISPVYGPNWNKQRKLAFERDNGACQVCGRTKEDLGREPDVHHIDFSKDNHDLNNLVTLCSKHHREAER